MSYKATNWAYDLPLSGSKKFVLVALADMADEANSCYPGQQRLADMTGRSIATVRRALEALEELGLLEREHRIGAGGHRTSDRYRLKVGLTLPESLPLKMPTRQDAHSATRQSQPLTVSIPTAHPARGTISRTTSKNHQGDMGSVSPVTNVSTGLSSNDSDQIDGEVQGSADVVGIANLQKLHSLLSAVVDGHLSPAGAVELTAVIIDRAQYPVRDVDAYVATACRQHPGDVNRWYVECDLGVA